jgi:predicted methyltransferase
MAMDLRESLNAVSDVIVNRPPPLREFDQIYMKAADMLMQAEHVSRWMSGRDVVFIGDGDALALCVTHLYARKHIERGPDRIHVLDFDERIVNSVFRFAERYGYRDRVSASLYNVADPLPPEHIARYGGFYTNPPFGGSNEGASVKAFLRRGLEALKEGGIGCAALADTQELPWPNQVLFAAQQMLLQRGCVIAEMIPEFHKYHLDDNPDLTSCSLIARHDPALSIELPKRSAALSADERLNFYGKGNPLKVRYVRDLTNGNKFASRDHRMEPFEGE